MRLVKKDESVHDTPKLGVLDNVLGWLANEVARISKPTPRSAHHCIQCRTPLTSFQFLRRSGSLCPLELVLRSLHHLRLYFPRLCFV